MPAHRWRRLWVAAAALLLQPRPAAAAGDTSLWELGNIVDENPTTVFTMFVFTVGLVVAIEVGKHHIESGTSDPHRRRALESIYSELMIMGVVSFLLILSAELGLTSLEIRKPWCDPDDYTASAGAADAAPADGSASGSAAQPCPATSSASGSGKPCYVGFDLLMFEYAHLVLFFMGITYAIFIQVAFMHKDRLCSGIGRLQEMTLASWLTDGPEGLPMYRGASLLGVMGVLPRSSSRKGKKSAWARAILMVRIAMCIHLEQRIRVACDKREEALEEMLAQVRHEDPPAKRAHPRDAIPRFDIARFTRHAMSEVLVEMIHVPPIVWVVVLVMAAANLLGAAGLDLAAGVLIITGTVPVVSLLLLWRMSAHLLEVCYAAAGHPAAQVCEFGKAQGNHGFAVPEQMAKRGAEWAQDPEKHPWEKLEGCIADDHCCNALDPLDPANLEKEIQAIVFACCFSVGQLVMLTNLIQDHMGALVLILCWVAPLIPLFFLVPRAILIYTLTHRTHDPPRGWLTQAVKEKDDPLPAHGHGHGHSHDHEEDVPSVTATMQEVVKLTDADVRRMWRAVFPSVARDLAATAPPTLTSTMANSPLSTALLDRNETDAVGSDRAWKSEAVDGDGDGGGGGHGGMRSGTGQRRDLRSSLKRALALSYSRPTERDSSPRRRLEVALDAFLHSADAPPDAPATVTARDFRGQRKPPRTVTSPSAVPTVAFGRPSRGQRRASADSAAGRGRRGELPVTHGSLPDYRSGRTLPASPGSTAMSDIFDGNSFGKQSLFY